MPRVTFKTEPSERLKELLRTTMRKKNASEVILGDEIYEPGEVTLDTFGFQETADAEGRVLAGELILAVRDPQNPHPIDKLEASDDFEEIAELITRPVRGPIVEDSGESEDNTDTDDASESSEPSDSAEGEGDAPLSLEKDPTNESTDEGDVSKSEEADEAAETTTEETEAEPEAAEVTDEGEQPKDA